MPKLTGLFVTVLLVSTAAVSSANQPITGSPGDLTRLPLVESRCPTFSWGTVDGVESYDLVVYRLGMEESSSEPVLSRRLAGSVSSWTPSLDLCLERGARYGWSVRAVAGGDVSEWSLPRLFAVTSRPSDEELSRALEVVRRYVDLRTEGADLDGSALSTSRPDGEGEGVKIAQGRPSAISSAPLQPPEEPYEALVDSRLTIPSDLRDLRRRAAVFARAEGPFDTFPIGVWAQGTGTFSTGVRGEGNVGVSGIATVGTERHGVAGRANDPSGRGGFFSNSSGPGLEVWGDALLRDGLGVGVSLSGNPPTVENRLVVKDAINAGAGLTSNHVALIENTSTGTSADVLALKVGTANPAGAANFVTFFGGDNDIGSIEGTGGPGVTLKSGTGDFAEYLPKARPLEVFEPGDVVGLEKGRLTRSTTSAERVFVVTSHPIVAGSHPGRHREADYELVAFLGQVPVKIRGPVEAGEYLFASGRNDGVAVALAASELTIDNSRRLVGRALESASADDRSVRALVGLPEPLMLAACE